MLDIQWNTPFLLTFGIGIGSFDGSNGTCSMRDLTLITRVINASSTFVESFVDVSKNGIFKESANSLI